MEKILRRGIQCLADAIGQARINGLGPATEKDTFTTLPFRPIIVGGDDITFVCRADLGVWLTEIIFGALTKEQAGIKDPVTACAGIAIIKPSYPFQQGYELAEALCSNAKSHARHAGRVALNWLDFHILKGGTFSSLDDLRESVFAYRGNSLTGRPFALGKREEGWGLCRTSLKNIYRQEWSSSDVKKWRSLIYGQGRDLDIFRERLGEKGKSLPIPDAPGAREELGLPKPLDIIELMEIYPEELVNTECKE